MKKNVWITPPPCMKSSRRLCEIICNFFCGKKDDLQHAYYL